MRHSDRHIQLSNSIDRLANLVEGGHLMAASDPAEIFRAVADEIEALQKRVAVLEAASDGER